MLFQQKSDEPAPPKSLPKSKYPFDDGDAIRDDPMPNPFATPFATIPTPNLFATIPFAKPIRDNPIRDDPILNDSHWRRSQRFRRFPLVTILTIPIPIGDDLNDSDSHWRWSLTILIPICDTDPHLQCWFPFVTILPSPWPLFSELVSFYFIYLIIFTPSLFTFMFICLGSRTGGKTRIGINGMFQLLCSVLVCRIKQFLFVFLFVVVGLCIN